MPRRKTSLKVTRSSKKKHLRNLKVKQQLKKVLKEIHSLIAAKNIEEAKKLLTKAFSQLDKAAKKNIIHPGTADRRKSRLAKRLSASKSA
ncbi:MAG: 30S ribosomal protein S20 [Candidatus Omnitrophica bacterium]|nr:30S ribosomal protein S20 [Candidatus Omnitrophota bacterium]MBU1869447.1 30S ribosomal protein S20 [Candidatus Omnitrophota bacterium]